MNISTCDRMTHHATCDLQQLKMTFPLAVKKESEADMKEKERVEEKEEKIESIIDERMIMSGEEVAAEDIETEKEGGGKIDKETMKKASKEDTDEDSFDENLSNTGKHGWGCTMFCWY